MNRSEFICFGCMVACMHFAAQDEKQNRMAVLGGETDASGFGVAHDERPVLDRVRHLRAGAGLNDARWPPRQHRSSGDAGAGDVPHIRAQTADSGNRADRLGLLDAA